MTFHAETPKDVGCCSSCDKEVFEIRARWPIRDNPYAGRPKEVGLPFENARRMDFKLSNDSISSFTVCIECEEWLLKHHEVWPLLWRKAVREMEFTLREDVQAVLLAGRLGVGPHPELSETAKKLRAKAVENLNKVSISEYVKTDLWEDLAGGRFITT